MNQPKLYAFFCAEHSEENLPVMEVSIDKSLKYIGDIMYFIGQHAYKDYPYDNPIASGDKYFFGGSPDGFNDCLSDYLSLRNTSVMLRLNILSIGESVTNKELFLFLYILAHNMREYEFDSRLSVFVSKEILDLYLQETSRLLDLDTHPDDYVIY